MKRLIPLILSISIATTLFAVPARRTPLRITQADGKTLSVILCGDETFHYYTTLSGTPLLLGDDGNYHKATEQQLAARQRLAAPRAASQSRERQQRMQQRRSLRTRAIEGTKRGLVILVNFCDLEMKTTNAQQAVNNLFNQEGYNVGNHIGSVNDYFKSQSYGQLSIDFDVVGPYTLSKNMMYYGKNGVDGNDMHPGEMAGEAVRLADPDVNYRDYDWDGDGEVDQVFIIYAGYGESNGAGESTIWPHEWTLSAAAYYRDGTGPVRLDGVRVNTYACSYELEGKSGTTLCAIGTAVHEFSHCMGLPDMYDLSGSNFGMDRWSVMDYGCYGGPGDDGSVPTAYNAYERWSCGWLQPRELTNPCFVEGMQDITSAPDACLIRNSGWSDEYYVLQNVQATSWNKYLPGHGLLVMHIDYDSDAWYYNEVNKLANHQRATIIPADNRLDNSKISLSGDPYPGATGNHALTDTSRPAAKVFHRTAAGSNFMGRPIEDITEANRLISFTFMGGTLHDEDINSDGIIDSADIEAIYKAIITNRSEFNREDVNHDGRIDLQDALQVMTAMKK